MEAAATYTRGRDEHARQVAVLEAKARAVGTGRLLLVVTAVGLVVGIAWGHLGSWAWVVFVASLVGFGGLVMVHARVHEARDRAGAALRFHERGLARLEHAWDRLPETSARFRTAGHSFAGDLDVFGHGSLMQLVDATETRFGEERLAQLLSLEDARAWPGDAAERQAAVRDLAPRLAFREALAAVGGVVADERPDAAPLLAWAEAREALPSGLRLLGWAAPLALGGVLAWVSFAGAAPRLGGLAALVLLGVGAWVGTRLSPVLSVASAREQTIGRWRAMLALLEAERFEAPLLVRLRERLSAGGRTASAEIASLERVVGFADARRNEVFRLLLGPLLMWDIHCAAALLRWRARAGAHVRGWLEALGEIEALASLGSFAFEHPDFAWPELAADPVFEVTALGHPLIGPERVGNDVTIPGAGRALVVTGSNMSGKSTLLRAIGVNVVLASAGGPVCARAARIGPSRVSTSMRIEDSLEQGVSHFYAELRRLKTIVDRAHGSGAPVLFLLDEILHGTNSRERVLGACAVVRGLLAAGALGAVSTHDLGITALERELGGSVHNIHFEEQVEGDAMTFDYVLRPGIVQSSNALRLMRAVGIDVPDGHD